METRYARRVVPGDESRLVRMRGGFFLELELRQIATRILLADRLEGKLWFPDSFVDREPGPMLEVAAPGRPPELALEARVGRERVALPGRERLRDRRSRGLLLHSFANHELLALELMALALLRFVDAPLPFRRGLAQTLREEQRHLGLYLQRMQDLGVEFGEVPVNDFFWRCVADAPTPLDFVLRMALVFEQANLDFALQYQELFASVGDGETAAVLSQVHDDEIGHVRLGLHWFRAWKPPEKSDWDFFAETLTEPLGPSRAKGPRFDRQVRLNLGLEPEFVEKLELWGRSRGRPPTVWLFEPSCEVQVARGRPGYQAPRHLVELAEDLAPHLLFLAKRDDAVLLPHPPSTLWLRQLTEAGVVLPEHVADLSELRHRKLGGFSPWGWSPDTDARLAPLRSQLTVEAPRWKPALRETYGKDLAVQLREKLPREEWLAEPWGTVCRTEAEVEAARGPRCVIKARFKASGRDALVLAEGEKLDIRQAGWLRRILAEQGAVVVEPWCERLLDLSFHYDMKERLEFRGICRFLVHADGRFAGAVPGRWQEDLDPTLKRFLHGEGRDPRRLRRIAAQVAETIEGPLKAAGVLGPVGVDAFVYQTPQGPKLQPLLEINPRWTMGRVALALGEHLHPQTRALWSIHTRKEIPDFAEWARQLPPLECRDGFWYSGTLCTNDPFTSRQVVGLLRLEGPSGITGRLE